jgi:hypothetical protein
LFGGGKDRAKCVADGFEHMTIARGDGGAHDLVMAGDSLPHDLAVGLPALGAAFDIGKEERDCASRSELVGHGALQGKDSLSG